MRFFFGYNNYRLFFNKYPFAYDIIIDDTDDRMNTHKIQRKFKFMKDQVLGAVPVVVDVPRGRLEISDSVFEVRKTPQLRRVQLDIPQPGGVLQTFEGVGHFFEALQFLVQAENADFR